MSRDLLLLIGLRGTSCVTICTAAATKWKTDCASVRVVNDASELSFGLLQWIQQRGIT
jgi:hypothetical protein